MMLLRNYAPAGIAFCILLTGCGGGSSTSSATPEDDVNSVLTGIFVDSPVEGISFATATQSGTTNAAGEFSYLAGEQVTFSIGTTQLPAVAAAAQVSPVDIAASSGNPTAMTTNIARLLQSLDLDGNADNGITISASAAASAASINFDVSVDDFANDAAVINLVANSDSVNSGLISEVDAISHLEEELNTEISSVNNATQTGPVFSSEMLVGRTLIPFPIDGALNPHSTTRFDSSIETMVLGTPGGELRAGEFPWTIDNNGVVIVDFDSFEAGTLATLELESNNEGVLTVIRTWQGNPDPTLTYTLSTPVSTSDFAGRNISVQTDGGVGSVEFLASGEFSLSNSSGDFQSGPYAQHPIDGITIGDVPSSYSELVLASGTLDSGYLIKSDYGDSGILKVEVYQTNGNNWTLLHAVSR